MLKAKNSFPLLSLFLTLMLMLASCTLLPPTDAPNNAQTPSDTPVDDERPSHSEQELPDSEHLPSDQHAPYTLSFVSNGDRTCYVSDIKTNPSYAEYYTLDIPQKSPTGDTVTAIQFDGFKTRFTVPKIILENDFNDLIATLEKSIGGTHDFNRFYSFFERQDVATATSEATRQSILKRFPIAEFSVIYTLDAIATTQDFVFLQSILCNHAYTAQKTKQWIDNLWEISEKCTPQNRATMYDILQETFADFDETSVSTQITSITLPESIKDPCWTLYSTCYYLRDITLPNNITEIPEGALGAHFYLTSISIPKGVTSIGNSAFAYCYELTTITIPEGVTSIGSDAFACCFKLTTITIPKSVTSIGSGAFAHCRELPAIIIPESVAIIENGTFESCSNLTTVELPQSITSIGSDAFAYCHKLTAITIPKNVTSIGSSAFSSCEKLTTITIPEGVTVIEDRTFSDCSNLTTVEIPKSITSIGSFAFSSCSNLTTIYFKGSEQEWDAIEKNPSWDSVTKKYAVKISRTNLPFLN